jgi:hypothetical protein
MAGKRTQRFPSLIATVSTMLALLGFAMTRTSIVDAISHHLKYSGSSRSVRLDNSNPPPQTVSIKSDVSEKGMLAGRMHNSTRESGSHGNTDNIPTISTIQKGVFVNRHVILQVHVSIDVTWSDDKDLFFLDRRSDIDQEWNVTIDGFQNQSGSACIESPLHLNQAVIPRWITAANETNSRGISRVSFAVPITPESCKVRTLIVALVESSSRLNQSTILTRRLTNVPEKNSRSSDNRKFNPIVKVELQATTSFPGLSQSRFKTSSFWMDLLLCGFVSSAACIFSSIRAMMCRDKLDESSVAKNEVLPLDINCEDGPCEVLDRHLTSPTADDTVQQDAQIAIHDADGNKVEILPLPRDSLSDIDDMSCPGTLEKPPTLVRQDADPFDITFVPQQQRRLAELKEKESSLPTDLSVSRQATPYNIDPRVARSQTDAPSPSLDITLLSVLSSFSQQALEVVATSRSPSVGATNTAQPLDALKTARVKHDPKHIDTIGQPSPPRNALNSPMKVQAGSFGAVADNPVESDEEDKQPKLFIATEDNRLKPKNEEVEPARSATTKVPHPQIDHDAAVLDERRAEEHDTFTLQHSLVDKAISVVSVTAHYTRCLDERLVENQGAEVTEQKYTEGSTSLSLVAAQSIDDACANEPKHRVESLDDQNPRCKVFDCEDLSRGDIDLYISRSSRLPIGYSNEAPDVLLSAFTSELSPSKTCRSSLLGRKAIALTQKKDATDLKTIKLAGVPSKSLTITQKEPCLAKEGNRSWLRRLKDRSNQEHLRAKQPASFLSECGAFTLADIGQGKHNIDVLSEQMRQSDEKSTTSTYCSTLPSDSDCHASRYSKKRISQQNASDLSSRVDTRTPTKDKGDDLLDFAGTDSSSELQTVEQPGQARKKSKRKIMYKATRTKELMHVVESNPFTHSTPCMSIKVLGAHGSPTATRKPLKASKNRPRKPLAASCTVEAQRGVGIPDLAPSSSLVTVATQILAPVWNFLAEESTMKGGKSRKRKRESASVEKKCQRSTPNPSKQGSTLSPWTSSIGDGKRKKRKVQDSGNMLANVDAEKPEMPRIVQFSIDSGRSTKG